MSWAVGSNWHFKEFDALKPNIIAQKLLVPPISFSLFCSGNKISGVRSFILISYRRYIAYCDHAGHHAKELYGRDRTFFRTCKCAIGFPSAPFYPPTCRSFFKCVSMFRIRFHPAQSKRNDEIFILQQTIERLFHRQGRRLWLKTGLTVIRFD